jgi:hypothetical protein
MTKNELIEICKSKGLPYSGTKDLLIERISTIESNKNETINLIEEDCTKNNFKQSKLIIKKLAEKIPNINLTRNAFGNYEHLQTKLLFDNKTQKVCELK